MFCALPALMPLEMMRERVLLAQMDHLGAGIGLLEIVGDGDGIEFAHAIVAAQDAAGIFPGDGRAGFHLGPGNLGAVARGNRRAW